MREKILQDIDKIATDEEIKKGRFLLDRKRKIFEISSHIEKVLGEEKNEEKLIIFLRRHWINLFFQLLPFAALILLLIVTFVLISLVSDFNLSPMESRIMQFGGAIFSLFIWAFLFIVFIDFYLDIWIVTNERIINIEQKGLFRREISELRLEKVQDLTTEIKGIICTLFDFGDLYVQTAGKRERFFFQSIPHPERVKDVILVLSEKEEEEEKKA